MQAEIIAIGDEITSGQLLDTNTQWLSLRLEELGIRVLYHTTVGDELDAITDVFRRAIERADVIIATGGLGPTADDLTRQAVAEAAGVRLVMNEEALAHVRSIFARRKYPMPGTNEVQGLLPEGARMIFNPNGTAPGVEMAIARSGRNGCHLYALPGVPAEMFEMWHGTLEGALREVGGGRRVVRHRKIKCFGAGESRIEEMLPDMIRRGREPRVGINASKTTIILRITAEGATEEECYAAMEPTVATIRECLGDLVFGEGDDELQHAVCRLLKERGKTLATAEWGTGGMIADWLNEVPDASDVFVGGLLVSCERAVQRTLGVAPEIFGQHGSISEQVAAAMATSCRRQFGADYGLAVGAFPQHDPQAKSPASFHLALATADGVATKSYPYAAHPAVLKLFCAKRALNFVRLAML
ncbi:MAG: CinA family nicotinamide mononucleotide deamidase-related protein [Planctomycetaceae bacterium]|nr:CinA family nicotinamide mononucleotide deamidase-related protein [Planctomycetaceae bacterium]